MTERRSSSQDRWQVLGVLVAIVSVVVAVVIWQFPKAVGSPVEPPATVIATAPGSPTADRSSTPLEPTSNVTPTPSSVLPYHADWSTGTEGWNGGGDWKRLTGKLLNDGTGPYCQYAPIYAPVNDETIADYAVTASIRVIRVGSSFGLLARSDRAGRGYIAGAGQWAGEGPVAAIGAFPGCWGTNDSDGLLTPFVAFDPGTASHSFELRVQGNQISFSVDGGLVSSVTDNVDLEPGAFGIWSNRYELEVTTFSVEPLSP